VIPGPYSNRGKRIGDRISIYEERKRKKKKKVIEYTCVICKNKRSFCNPSPDQSLPKETKSLFRNREAFPKQVH
jgi:hypothetical protein